jgi:pilus assembly protein CpaC
VPGINTRRVHTTVELREGESLALAGLLQVTLDANTARLPLLGDLPVLGPFFSNTTHRRVEKELLVLVTPYLVRPMNAQDVPLLPGDEVEDPSDLEFYLLNRIERGHTEKLHHAPYRHDPLRLPRVAKSQKIYVNGPVGFAPPADKPVEALPLPVPSRRTNGEPLP